MQHEDYKWYLENHADLYNKYGTAYIAIKDKKVIGVYNSYAEGVIATKKKEKLGTFIVQKCGADETAYTVYISSMNFCS